MNASSLSASTDVVNDTEALGALGRDGLCRKCHLLHDAKRAGVQKREHAGDIVGHAEPSGRHGKGGRRCGDDEVAGEGHLARSAPDAAFDHGDDGGRELLDGPNEIAQRIIPTQRIAAALGKLADVMPG